MEKNIKLIRALVMGGIALAVAGGIAALTLLVFIPLRNYNRASTLEQQGDLAGAFDTYDRVGDFRDALDRKLALQQAVFATRSAPSMDFGGYTWLVLEEKDGKALLLLRDTLEAMSYNETMTPTDWASSTLRQWLNDGFYNSFSEKDRPRVAETAVKNDNSVDYRVAGGKDTDDHVFLLSLAEAKLYFADDAARIARGPKGQNAYWWLRSPGAEPILAAIVQSDGSLGFAGSGMTFGERYVRPAMWVTK